MLKIIRTISPVFEYDVTYDLRVTDLAIISLEKKGGGSYHYRYWLLPGSRPPSEAVPLEVNIDRDDFSIHGIVLMLERADIAPIDISLPAAEKEKLILDVSFYPNSCDWNEQCFTAEGQYVVCFQENQLICSFAGSSPRVKNAYKSGNITFLASPEDEFCGFLIDDCPQDLLDFFEEKRTQKG